MKATLFVVLSSPRIAHAPFGPAKMQRPRTTSRTRVLHGPLDSQSSNIQHVRAIKQPTSPSAVFGPLNRAPPTQLVRPRDPESRIPALSVSGCARECAPSSYCMQQSCASPVTHKGFTAPRVIRKLTAGTAADAGCRAVQPVYPLLALCKVGLSGCTGSLPCNARRGRIAAGTCALGKHVELSAQLSRDTSLFTIDSSALAEHGCQLSAAFSGR